MSGYFLRLLARASAGGVDTAPAFVTDVAEAPFAESTRGSQVPNGGTLPHSVPPAWVADTMRDAPSLAVPFLTPPRADDAGYDHAEAPLPPANHGELMAPRMPEPPTANAAGLSETPPRTASPAAGKIARPGRSLLPREIATGAAATKPEPRTFPAPLTPPAALRPPTSRAPVPTPISPAPPPPAPAPDVHVTIGRIEVIAASPAVPRAEPTCAPRHTPLSLDAYLAQRGRRR